MNYELLLCRKKRSDPTLDPDNSQATSSESHWWIRIQNTAAWHLGEILQRILLTPVAEFIDP
jgi:hypothetical protein